ncbi:MAG: hypothetical protein ACP5F8_02455 [Candidatus Aenigmatarchaeota archaeon]
MDYWKIIEEEINSKKGWISLDDIVKKYEIPKWVADLWLKNRKQYFNVKWILDGGNRFVVYVKKK